MFKNSLTPNAPIWRANWAVFNDLDGPLDLFTPDGHDERNEANQTIVYQGHFLYIQQIVVIKIVETIKIIIYAQQNYIFSGEETGRMLVFRAEYQTLTKLPKTKAIVFSIRTYQR